MYRSRLSLAWSMTLTIFVILAMATASHAQTYKILHNFGTGSGGDTDGFWLWSGVTMDNKGNLYGTTAAGGTGTCGQYGCGIVYQLTPNSDGTWTENVLHNFNGSDGAGPWSPVAFDGRGNLYGTTTAGGSYDYGTVFEMTPNSNGTWTLVTLHSFTGGSDGATPEYPGLTLDNAGHIYGAASAGGVYGYGVVFDLGHVSVFNWYELVAHAFASGNDGDTPYGNLIFDAEGNLYGTTYYGGGPTNAGTVFKLTPNKLSFGWTETILHSFSYDGSDGACASAGLVFDADGNLYSTTEDGGTVNNGTVFKLSPNSDGTWTETIIDNFDTYGSIDGLNPVSGVIFDQAGNLYSTTSGGGLYGEGMLFKLTPSSGGQWTETIVHSFGGTVNGQYDGVDPQGALIIDSAGNIYGTTLEGGPAGITRGGVVFEITP
jgi:uncharacterized repeat protein (TIGR03803 family)